jgi:hypothetical protein
MAAINNSEFLLTVFGNAPEGAVPWVAGFKEDPLKVDGRRWGGLPVVNCTLPWFVESDTNNFVAISTFRKGADGKYHRRKENFAACHLIMVDDVGTKIQPWQIPLEPSYKLETSPGNYQYGYLLAALGLDGDLVARVVDAMIAQGLAVDGKDPGMKGVTRYGRLPVGWNTKAKYVERLGAPFVHQLEEWHPARRFTLQEIIEAFELDLDRVHTRGGGRVETDDSILKMLEARGLVKGPVNGKAGIWNVICPWVDEHTDRVDSGAAYFQPHFDGRDKPGYRCHHGHCENRNVKDLLRFLGLGARNDDPPPWDDPPAESYADDPYAQGQSPEGTEAEGERTKRAEGDQEASTWPDPLSKLAYHGLAGDIVRIIEPHSEAASEAILIQTLTAFGNIIGRGPFYLVEGDKHPTNLFCVLVGETAKGRKGTSWGRALQVFSLIDDPWARDRIESGLSSGEGLIWTCEIPSPGEKRRGRRLR